MGVRGTRARDSRRGGREHRRTRVTGGGLPLSGGPRGLGRRLRLCEGAENENIVPGEGKEEREGRALSEPRPAQKNNMRE